MKKALGPNLYLFPMPTVLVGTKVDGKDNFRTIAFCGMVQLDPPALAVSIGLGGYTNKGIRESGGFSVNIPSENLVELTDYFGLVSGENVDKAAMVHCFYGKLGNIPMIEECPVSLECKLTQVLNVGGDHELFIGEIVDIHCDESVLRDGKPQMDTVKPILFSCSDNGYWKSGDYLAQAYEIGTQFMK